MRFKKLGSEEVGESQSLRHRDPVTGEEQISLSDQDLSMSPPLEDEPDFRDILPDQIQRFRGAPEDDNEEEITARPMQSMHPITMDELPEE